MRDRTDWTRGVTGPQRIGTKLYPRLVEFSRKCVTCQKPFSIFVTEKIAEGLADTNNFGLKNCEQHRRGGVPLNGEEVEEMRVKDRVMADEIAGLYTINKELTAEVAALKNKLAQYELQPAMVAVASGGFPWK